MMDDRTFLERAPADCHPACGRDASGGHDGLCLGGCRTTGRGSRLWPVRPSEFSGTGSRNRQLRVHGFTELDDSDGTIGLVIGKWSDSEEPETLTTTVVNQLSGWLESFVLESVESRLNERIAEANPAYELACQLQNMGTRINRIRLHIFSNQPLTQRFKEEQCGKVAGTLIERHIWDLQRLKAMYESSRERGGRRNHPVRFRV